MAVLWNILSLAPCSLVPDNPDWYATYKSTARIADEKVQ